jgi:hypothetical protein
MVNCKFNTNQVHKFRIDYFDFFILSSFDASLGGGGVMSSPANSKVAGLSPALVVYPPPKGMGEWVFVCPNLFDW